jgi:hypothetical protein
VKRIFILSSCKIQVTAWWKFKTHGPFNLLKREREREREKRKWGGKVPRQCPLVLLAEEMLVSGI